jgi:4-hydroxybenzoate polyprenyltransferase
LAVSWQGWSAGLAAAAMTSVLLYAFGMILNDWADVDQDRIHRPDRPLPSGAISHRTALIAAILLASLGLASAAAAGVPTLWVAASLVVVIVLYDVILKQTVVAPWVMGVARGLNLALGVSAANTETLHAGTNVVALYILAHVVYTAGITWFARTEATVSNRPMLAFGAGLIAAGVGIHIALQISAMGWQPVAAAIYLITLLSVGIPVVQAIGDPRPARVQRAVKSAVLSIVNLAVAVASLWGGAEPALTILLWYAAWYVGGRILRGRVDST